MFRIITLNGVELGLTDKPRYISKGASGSYVETEKEKARGISYKGTIYNLVGKPSIGGTETVIVVGSSNAEEFERQEEKARVRQSIADIAFVVAVEEEKIDDTSALEHAEVFAEWATNVNYKIGNVRRYKELLYRCIQAHTSQESWTPDVTAALWKAIGDPREEYPEWSQPIGAFDAYNLGDKVTHNGTKWHSTVDNNVWEPSVYGWEQEGN